MVFGDLFNAMIDPKQETAKKVPKHMPDFAVAAANPDLAVKMVLYHLEYNRHVFAHTLRSALSLSLSLRRSF